MDKQMSKRIQRKSAWKYNIGEDKPGNAVCVTEGTPWARFN